MAGGTEGSIAYPIKKFCHYTLRILLICEIDSESEPEWMAVKELINEIEIEASASRVWQVLTDFSSYPEWNPFIRRISGQPKEGRRLKVYIEPPRSRGRVFRPKVLKAQPPRELRWLGRLLIPGLFDGDHLFSIERLGSGRVRFVQREIFSGLLVSFLIRGLDAKIRLGFEQMNQALKLRTEQGGRIEET
jgi:hypothetical protein